MSNSKISPEVAFYKMIMFPDENEPEYTLCEEFGWMYDDGWMYDEYNDLHNKASYLITAIFSFDKEETDNMLDKLKSILDTHHITYSIPEPKVKSCQYRKKNAFTMI